jgi:hypothetical protein
MVLEKKRSAKKIFELNSTYFYFVSKYIKKYGKEFSKENWDLDSTSLTKNTNCDTNTMMTLI